MKRRRQTKAGGLKTGHEYKSVKHIEHKITEERRPPDAVTGNIKAKGLRFETSICTKALHNYIDKEIFVGISNKYLCGKEEGKKHNYKKIRPVALNNRKCKGIPERPKGIGKLTW